MRNSTLYEHGHNEDYDHRTTYHNAHTSISMSNTLHITHMQLLFLLEKYHISILDGQADTFILGKG
jgi:hypothetical protein